MGEVRSLLAPPPLRPTGLPTVLLHLLQLPLLLQLLPLLSRLPTTGLPRLRPPTGLHSLHLLARLLLLPRPGVDPVSGARLHFQHPCLQQEDEAPDLCPEIIPFIRNKFSSTEK